MGLPEVLARIERAARRAGRDPAGVRLVAVTKGHSPEAIREKVLAYGDFPLGESRVQEALPKIEALPEATFHFIGPLQRNKAKFMDRFALLHSLESFRVAEALERRLPRPLDVLVEVNVGREPQKHGVLPEALPELLSRLAELSRVRVLGLMTVAPRVRDPQRLRAVFAELSRLADRYNLPERSMGMSEDFELAIEEGSTLVRVGRAIFDEL